MVKQSRVSGRSGLRKGLNFFFFFFQFFQNCSIFQPFLFICLYVNLCLCANLEFIHIIIFGLKVPILKFRVC